MRVPRESGNFHREAGNFHRDMCQFMRCSIVNLRAHLHTIRFRQSMSGNTNHVHPFFCSESDEDEPEMKSLCSTSLPGLQHAEEQPAKRRFVPHTPPPAPVKVKKARVVIDLTIDEDDEEEAILDGFARVNAENKVIADRFMSPDFDNGSQEYPIDFPYEAENLMLDSKLYDSNPMTMSERFQRLEEFSSGERFEKLEASPEYGLLNEDMLDDDDWPVPQPQVPALNSKKYISDNIYTNVVDYMLEETSLPLVACQIVGNYVSDSNACKTCGVFQWCYLCLPPMIVTEDVELRNSYFF